MGKRTASEKALRRELYTLWDRRDTEPLSAPLHARIAELEKLTGMDYATEVEKNNQNWGVMYRGQ